MRSSVVLYNPVAGSALGRKAAEAAEQHLRKSGWDVSFFGLGNKLDHGRPIDDVSAKLFVGCGRHCSHDQQVDTVAT